MSKILMKTILMICTVPLVAQGNTDGAAVDPTGQGGVKSSAAPTVGDAIAADPNSQFSAGQAGQLEGCEMEEIIFCKTIVEGETV